MKNLILLLFSIILQNGYSQKPFNRNDYEAYKGFVRSADSLTGIKQFDKAILAYDNALKYKEDDECFFKRALVFMLRKDNERAIKDFTAIIDNKRTFLREAYYFRGFTLQSIPGQQSKGCDDIKTAVELGFEVDKTFVAVICGN